MSDPIEQLSKNAPSDPAKFNTVQALLIKFAFAFVLVFVLFVYFDKTSSLNGRSPEENRRLFEMNYNPETDGVAKVEQDGSAKSTSVSTSAAKNAKSRKT